MRLLVKWTIAIIFFIPAFIIPLSFLNPLWLLFHLYKWVVIIFAKISHPDFVKNVSPFDTIWSDDDYTKYTPRNSIISSFTLEGDISLGEFCKVFESTVLEATLTSSSASKHHFVQQTRYPELKQYQVDFLGYKFLKLDPTFKIENHIFEVVYKDNQPTRAMIHQEAVNKLYSKKQSPWDVTLIRNYEDEYAGDGLERTLVVARFHHSIADAKSMMKLFVECLGQQPLSLAKAQQKNENVFKEILFYITFPFKFLSQICFVSTLNSTGSLDHPWRADVFGSEEQNQNFSQNVGLSPSLSLEDVKAVARRNFVTTSSVIMAMISGAISEMDESLRKKEVHIGYILPKSGHPPTLGTHACLGTIMLPTNETSVSTRLQKCSTAFNHLKASNQDRYNDYGAFQAGMLPNPLRKLVIRNFFLPVGITNIAGESSGFSVAGKVCSDFIFSVGTLTGCQGVSFCVSSYKNSFRVSVTAESTILDEFQVQKLVNGFGNELEKLKQL